MPRVTDKAIIKLTNGRDALYSGEVNAHGRPHGYGELSFDFENEQGGQVVRRGMFVEGALQGVGKIITPDGHRMTGEFVNGSLDGVGFCEWPNGQRYSGQWKGHKRHGFGTCTLSDGREYIGWWADDKYQGIALFVYADGSKAAMTYEHDKEISATKGNMNNAGMRRCSLRLDPQMVLRREKEMNGLCLGINVPGMD
jgi:hypothetical protein